MSWMIWTSMTADDSVKPYPFAGMPKRLYRYAVDYPFGQYRCAI